MIKTSIEICDRIRQILTSHTRGIPLVEVKEQLIPDYSEDQIADAINHGLDTILFEQILDRSPTDEFGNPIWFLRSVDEKRVNELRNLKSIDFTLIRILQQQDEYKRLGQMTTENARAALRERGFDDRTMKRLWVTGFVDIFWRAGDVRWCRITPEYEKETMNPVMHENP